MSGLTPTIGVMVPTPHGSFRLHRNGTTAITVWRVRPKWAPIIFGRRTQPGDLVHTHHRRIEYAARATVFGQPWGEWVGTYRIDGTPITQTGDDRPRCQHCGQILPRSKRGERSPHGARQHE